MQSASEDVGRAVLTGAVCMSSSIHLYSGGDGHWRILATHVSADDLRSSGSSLASTWRLGFAEGTESICGYPYTSMVDRVQMLFDAVQGAVDPMVERGGGNAAES